MNKKELVEIIRTVVREEVDRALPQLLMEVLAEKIVNQPTSVVESRQPAPVQQPVAPRRRPQVGVEGSLKMPAAKAPKVFSNNPLLNQVLNETVGGVPQSPDDPGLVMEGMGMDSPAGRSVHDVIGNVSEAELSENPAVAQVADALTRDYSKFLKAVDAKAKAKRP